MTADNGKRGNIMEEQKQPNPSSTECEGTLRHAHNVAVMLI